MNAFFDHSASEPAAAGGRFDPVLWRRFADAADDPDAFHRSWLALQCALIPNVVQGVVVLGDADGGSFAPVANWPEGGHDSRRLAEICERVLAQGCGLLAQLDCPEGNPCDPFSHYAVAYPIELDTVLRGMVAVEMRVDSQDPLKAAMGHLQWGVSWIEVGMRRTTARDQERSCKRLGSAVDMLAAVLSENGFQAAGMALVTELATVMACDRVSLAFMRGGRLKIQAISHSARFTANMNLVRAIGKAMDEALFQRTEIVYPPPPDAGPQIDREHDHLARQHGSKALLSMPFFGQDRYTAALTLERSEQRPFSRDDAAFVRSVAALVLPALEIKRRDDRLLVAKIADAVKAQITYLFGPGHLKRKVIGLTLAVVVLFVSLKTGENRISAPAILEGSVKRLVVAPFDGYIGNAFVRAGDTVESGSPLCNLDERDLRLERLNWLSKRSQFQRQLLDAIAKHDRAEAEILRAQLEQTSARIELVENHLERTRITAPFDAVVLSGDLSQRLGGAVKKGDILFELTPLDSYRVIIEVDERRIADVVPGQRGVVLLSALPDDGLGFVVEKTTPIAAAKEGANHFRVEARLETASPRLRPGMEGVGKIHVDRRRLIWIWTRDLRAWLVIKLWSWWP